MTPLDLSSDVGLVALWLLTANVLMGLLLSVRPLLAAGCAVLAVSSVLAVGGCGRTIALALGSDVETGTAT